MAKKNENKTLAEAGLQSQSRDSKGVNLDRDGKRAKGLAAVGVMRHQGTKAFRKRRAGGE